MLARIQLLPMLGVDVFLDLLSIDPGDRWRRELYKHIDGCDLFLLFWSRSAKASKWVREETRYALARKKGDEAAPPKLFPAILPPPPPPVPWPELQDVHFNDGLIYVMAAEGALRR